MNGCFTPEWSFDLEGNTLVAHTGSEAAALHVFEVPDTANGADGCATDWWNEAEVAPFFPQDRAVAVVSGTGDISVTLPDLACGESLQVELTHTAVEVGDELTREESKTNWPFVRASGFITGECATVAPEPKGDSVLARTGENLDVLVGVGTLAILGGVIGQVFRHRRLRAN